MAAPHPIHDKLKSIPLFHDFTDAEIEEFLNLADPKVYRTGDFIVKQGDEGNAMFYVAEGTCSVTATRDGERIELDQLGPGDIFGEVSLFDQLPRSADVQALSNCILLSVNEGVLRALAAFFPAAAFKFMLGIAREMSNRLRRSNKRYVDSMLAPH
jgi:CRP/FNR family transcriptional regulator, cyclic AMP receptor protein